MKRDKKTSSELIVDALRTGRELKLSEITKFMSEYTGREIKVQNVSSTMAKLSDSEKTELGHFISKQKTRQGYVYKMADEAMALSPEQMYDLVRKVGKNRFTLADALEQVPALKGHVKTRPAKKTRRTKKRTNGAVAASGNPAGDGPGTGENAKDKTNDASPAALQFSKVLEQFKNGAVDVNVNVNIRLIGFE